MSSSNRPVRPSYTLKLANTKNEVEACYDIRMEGASTLRLLPFLFFFFCFFLLETPINLAGAF